MIKLSERMLHVDVLELVQIGILRNVLFVLTLRGDAVITRELRLLPNVNRRRIYILKERKKTSRGTDAMNDVRND